MKSLTRLVVAFSSCSILALMAMAGGEPIDAKDKTVMQPAAPPVCTWTGFYIGANLGGAWGMADARTTTLLIPGGYNFVDTDVTQIADAGSQNIDTAGFTGGGQVGYNFQTGHFVFGAEADFNALELDDSRSDTQEYISAPGTSFTIKQSVSTDWLITARARLGFTAGHFLFYGTGGLAVTKINYDESFTDTFAAARENSSIRETKAGWTVGGGIEYQLNCHWSLKAEYLYADFGRVSATSTNLTAIGGPFPQNAFSHSSDLTAHIARFGVNYKF